MIKTTIQNILKSAEAAGELKIVKLQQTESIFSTDGLESKIPPDKSKLSKYIKSNHKVVYDIVIVSKNGVENKILFTAMLTDLLDDDDIRTRFYRANGVSTHPGVFGRTNLIKSLDVTNDTKFLLKLEIAVKYYLEVAIPAFEQRL